MLIADTCRVAAYGSTVVGVLMALPLRPPSGDGTEYPGLFVLVAFCAVITGAAEVLKDNAAQSYLPALVPKEELERANSILFPMELVMNLLAGTALSGVLIGISIALPFGVSACTMLISVLLVWSIPVKDRAKLLKPPDWWFELREGVKFLVSRKELLGLALMGGGGNFVFFGLQLTVILIVQERLDFGPLAVSAIMVSGALGGIVAGAVNKSLVSHFKRGNILRAAMTGMLAFPLSVLLGGQGYMGLALICLGFFVNEFWGVTSNTITMSYRQQVIPPELLGRVISAYRFFVKGAAPLGMLFAGLLIHVCGKYFERDFALLTPYLIALALYPLFAFLAWRFLARIFETR